jgi:nucleoside-diphosphate-sugar epimerase
MRVFVAGASGALGRHLLPHLVAAGHEVVGSVRTAEKASLVTSLGAQPVVMDGLDRASVEAAVTDTKPEVIIHQMTALRGNEDLRHFDRSFALTNRLRTEGLDLLLEAGLRTGVGRLIAQSYCGWPFRRDGGASKSETDPLDDHVAPQAKSSLRAIKYLETKVTGTAMEGVALRYGGFYAPGTGIFDPEFLRLIRKRQVPVIGGGGGFWSFIQLEDAASATAAFVTGGAPGIYNVVDDEPALVRHWLPGLAAMLGARPPLRVPKWIARIAAGEHAVNLMTNVRGGSNRKLKAEIGWAPKYPSWRQGFAAVLAKQEADD